jgi:hypothetical protein
MMFGELVCNYCNFLPAWEINARGYITCIPCQVRYEEWLVDVAKWRVQVRAIKRSWLVDA